MTEAFRSWIAEQKGADSDVLTFAPVRAVVAPAVEDYFSQEKQSASLQILNFTSDGALAGDCPCGTGGASGRLPAALTFDNGSGFNDYFDELMFGTTISFYLSLYGPALSAPDGVSTSGTTFAFSRFFDPAGTIPVLTSDTTDGFAFTVDVNLDGTDDGKRFLVANQRWLRRCRAPRSREPCW